MHNSSDLTLDDVARISRPCDPATEWAATQPDRNLRALWVTCPQGDWLLWLADVVHINTRAIGYWCAERARQTAIRMLTEAGVECAELRACAPITNSNTAYAARVATQTAEMEATASGAWTLVETTYAAWSAAVHATEGAAPVAAVWAAEIEAEKTTQQIIADYVRTQIDYAQVEAGLRARLSTLRS